MSVIFRRVLLKLALRTKILLKLSRGSTLSIWNEETPSLLRVNFTNKNANSNIL